MVIKSLILSIIVISSIAIFFYRANTNELSIKIEDKLMQAQLVKALDKNKVPFTIGRKGFIKYSSEFEPEVRRIYGSEISAGKSEIYPFDDAHRDEIITKLNRANIVYNVSEKMRLPKYLGPTNYQIKLMMLWV